MMLAFLSLPNVAASESSPDAKQSPLNGTYRHVGGESETRAVEEAIDEAVAELNVFIRGIARRRLREPNLPADWMKLDIGADQAAVAQKGRPTIAAPLDEPPVEWKNPNNGNTLRVSYRAQSSRRLEQRLRGDRGLSVIRYELEDDGNTLSVVTTITADLLEQPLTFQTTYRREGSPP
jgi:hypothetical protein